jgi:hypothetical protein
MDIIYNYNTHNIASFLGILNLSAVGVDIFGLQLASLFDLSVKTREPSFS